MRFLSVCSGIEAASVAWAPLGWRAVAFSEIEPFPCSVLAHHYPDVPNRGDMTKFKDWPDGAIDLLCGGTPCQSFSVAGLRAGLDDQRGDLMLTFGAIAAKYRPRWLVWENVPGVLSSNGGRDFGSFLGLLGQLGYGFAYRVFDAQYFGVPQRRGRVFVVGCLGDWRAAAAVLFERHSLQGHPAPRREAGQGTAPSLTCGADAGGNVGQDEFMLTVANTLTAHTGIAAPDYSNYVTSTLNAAMGKGKNGQDVGALVPVAFDTTQITSLANRSNPQPGDPCHTLAKGAHAPAVAFGWQNSAQQGDSASAHCSPTLDKSKTPAVHTGTGVRRLLPIECERLMGFPDDYTAVPHRGKPAADGPRYKSLGNSWAVPVVRWIGQRIDAVEGVAQMARRCERVAA